MTRFCQLFLAFCIYSFLGWVCESTYCSLGERRWINRGFLAGPVCPVYGFGAVIVVTLLTPFAHSIPLLFLTGMAATSALEYLTGFLLETLFHTKWWDYSKRRFNIRGRVCLRNSLMFGGLSVVAMRLVDPVVQDLIGKLHGWALYIVTGGMLALFAADTAISVRAVLQMNGKLEQLQRLAAEIRRQEQARRVQRREALQERLGAHQESVEASLDRLRRRMEETRMALAARNKRMQARLLRAFPHMQPHGRELGLEQLRAALEEYRQARMHKKGKK